MELGINTIIKLALFMVVALVIIYLAGIGILDPVRKFVQSTSQSERCEGRTVSEYESLIKGYSASSEAVQEYQLCLRYDRCFPIEFRKFKENNNNLCARTAQ